MGVEIERKFKVRGDFRPSGSGTEIAQGYLSRDPKRTVRVRIAGSRGFLTIKGENRAGRRWEIDVFHGANDGLIIAEVELPSADAEVTLPPWAEAEVTGESRYYNSALITHPYAQWTKEERVGYPREAVDKFPTPAHKI